MNRDELFEILYGKDKVDIYRKYQEIEAQVEDSDEYYKYIEDFINMLGNERSTVRLRAFKLICRLSKYDSDNRVDDNIDLLLSVLDDSKGSIVRQALSDIEKLLLYKPKLRLGIENKLDAIDLSKYKDSMWPLILKDIQCIKASIKHIET